MFKTIHERKRRNVCYCHSLYLKVISQTKLLSFLIHFLSSNTICVSYSFLHFIFIILPIKWQYFVFAHFLRNKLHDNSTSQHCFLCSSKFLSIISVNTKTKVRLNSIAFLWLRVMCVCLCLCLNLIGFLLTFLC